MNDTTENNLEELVAVEALPPRMRPVKDLPPVADKLADALAEVAHAGEVLDENIRAMKHEISSLEAAIEAAESDQERYLRAAITYRALLEQITPDE